MKDFKFDTSWRTDTTTALCVSIRETQDFTALPILADALQEGGCPEDSDILFRLRNHTTHSYAAKISIVAIVLSEETALAAWWLMDFADNHDCPEYEVLLNAASGHHEENSGADGYRFSEISDWDASYLHFNGGDAHGDIPDEFWEKVELVTGLKILERPSRFSCSC